MQGRTSKTGHSTSRKPAFTPKYISPNQLTLDGFETPFDQKLNKNNRWVKLADCIPWDRIVNIYDHLFTATTGRPPISGRVVLGALIIKHHSDLTDRETIAQISENMFMQYFLGYSSFTNDEPFSHTLFVEIRERLTEERMQQINDIIAIAAIESGIFLDSDESSKENKEYPPSNQTEDKAPTEDTHQLHENINESIIETEDDHEKESVDLIEEKSLPNKGQLLMDATAAPQNIAYPNDIKVINSAVVKSQQLIDKLYDHRFHVGVKPRTYRKDARKHYLSLAQKKRKTQEEIYDGIVRQLRYLKRNLEHISKLLQAYIVAEKKVPFKEKDAEYYQTIQLVYTQQEQMHRTNTRSIEDRIVNIHQPYVRPIVRGKEKAKVEFGSKIQLALVAGFTFVDYLSWDAYNEGGYLKLSVENYKKRFGFYPAEVLADKIYCTRENRNYLKGKGIKLRGKPLGRPSAKAVANHISPGERNPIEGKFGQAKTAYGMDRIRAKLKTTSQSWIMSIILVLNLVKLARLALLCLLNKYKIRINVALNNINYTFKGWVYFQKNHLNSSGF